MFMIVDRDLLLLSSVVGRQADTRVDVSTSLFSSANFQVPMQVTSTHSKKREGISLTLNSKLYTPNGTVQYGVQRGRSLITFTRLGRQVVQKMSTFCQLSYHRKCQGRGVGGQKNQNFVNVVYERPQRREERKNTFFQLIPCYVLNTFSFGKV